MLDARATTGASLLSNSAIERPAKISATMVASIHSATKPKVAMPIGRSRSGCPEPSACAMRMATAVAIPKGSIYSVAPIELTIWFAASGACAKPAKYKRRHRHGPRLGEIADPQRQPLQKLLPDTFARDHRPQPETAHRQRPAPIEKRSGKSDRLGQNTGNAGAENAESRDWPEPVNQQIVQRHVDRDAKEGEPDRKPRPVCCVKKRLEHQEDPKKAA